MKKLPILLLFLLGFIFSKAQVSNNNCSSATFLSFTSNCNLTLYNNNGATLSGDAVASCGDYPTSDVWFKFVVPASGNIAIKSNYFNIRTDMAVYLGSCGSLTEYDCDRNSGLDYLMPYIEFHDPSIAGDTMFLQYWGQNADTGRFYLCVYEPDQPANTICDSAVALTVQQDFNYSYFTNAHAGASDEPAPPCAGYRTDDVWFKTTVPSSGKMIIRMVDNGIGNSAMAVYEGDCDTLTIYECNDNGGPNYLQPQIYIDDADLANEEIKIRVWKNNSIYGGGFGIVAMEPQLDSNNSIEGATMMMPEANCNWDRFNFSNYTNTNKVTPPCGTYLGPDIWFKTVVPSNGKMVISIRDVNSGNMAMALYTGTLDTLTLLRCDDNSGEYYLQPEIVLNDTALAGDTLYLVVWQVNSRFPNSFDLCIHSPYIPAYRDCSNAKQLQVKPSCNFERFTNRYAGSSGEGLPTCGAYAGTDVWFKFTVPNSGEFTIDTRSAGFPNYAMSLYTGSCGSLTEYSCDDNSSANGDNMPKLVISDTNLANQTMYLQVWRRNENNGDPFDLCIYGDLSPQIFNPQGAEICAGEDTPSLSVADGVFSYNWYDAASGGNLLASDTNRYTPSSAGTYYVEAVNSETLEKSARTAIELIIHPRPTLLNPSSVSYCENDTPSPLSTTDLGDVYNWYSTNTLSTLLATDTNMYLPSAEGSYFLLATDPITQCKSEIEELSFSKVATPLIATTRNITGCSNEAIFNLKVQDQGHTYNWYEDKDGTKLIMADTPQIMVNTEGTYYVQAIESTLGCKSEIDSIQLNIEISPILITGFDEEVCDSELPALLEITDLGDTYNWYAQRDLSNTLAIDASSYSTSKAGTFYVQAVDAFTSCKSNIDSIILTVTEAPLVVGPLGYISCDDLAYTGLKVTDQGNEYNWYTEPFNGTLMATNTATYLATVNGTYYVEAVDPISSCVSDERAEVVLKIFPEQDPLIAYDGDSLHTNTFISYQWYRNGIAIFGATEKSFDVLSSGFYYVEVTDSNGCEHTSDEVEIEHTLSIRTLATYNTKLYPNPVEQILNVEIVSPFIGSRLYIFDLSGKELSSHILSGSKTQISLGHLARGYYFIKVENELASQTFKVLKL